MMILRSRSFLLGCLTLAMACGGSDLGDGPSSADGNATVDPPDFDVYVGVLEVGADRVVVSELVNASNREGYDNQPSFTPDGLGVLFTAIDEAGQADIMRYDVASRESGFVTMTHPESEYSAIPMPSGDRFSAIRVEADSAQRLWSFDWNGEDAEVVIDVGAKVGYHAWADAETVVMFVLGSPPFLQVGNVTTGEFRTLEEGIGRSIQVSRGDSGVSWVSTKEDASMVMLLDPASGESRPLTAIVGEGQDHAWGPMGTLLMADGGQLHWWREGLEAWRPVDMDVFDGVISRLAVSPDGTRIALVGQR